MQNKENKAGKYFKEICEALQPIIDKANQENALTGFESTANLAVSMLVTRALMSDCSPEWKEWYSQYLK